MRQPNKKFNFFNFLESLLVANRWPKSLKIGLDGKTAYDCRMRFLETELLASCNSRHSTLPICTIVEGFFKLVLKSYDIFCDVHNSGKRVLRLIYMKQFMLYACCKLVACDRVVLSKSPFRTLGTIPVQLSCQANLERIII